jgi:hypothetical protein
MFEEMEDTVSSIRKAVMTASTRGMSVSTAIKRALISNRYTASTSYISSAKSSYVHKLPKITQTSPLRDSSYFLALAFPDGAPTILTTSYTLLSAMDQLDAKQAPVSTYDITTHSFTDATSTTVYSDAVYDSATTFTFVETVLDINDAVLSTTTKTTYRSVGQYIKAIRYTYLHLGLTKIRLYVPSDTDVHLFHDIFSTYASAEDFVAYPIYPIMLDSVYMDADSRKDEYEDASRLLKSISFPFEGVFESIKEGVPTESATKEHHITDIFLMNAISINTATQAGKSYLFEFFDAIYLNHVDPSTGVVDWVHSNYSVNISESDYNFKLNFNSITNTVEAGVRTDYDTVLTPGSTFDYYGEVVANTGDGTITLYAPSADGDTTHRKLVITGVTARTVVDYPSGLSTSVDIFVSTDTESLDYANFCIPLIHGVVAQLPSLQLKEEVFLESFVLVSHSITEYYLKWYKQLWKDIKKYVLLALAVLALIFIQDGGITAEAFFAAYAAALATSIVLELILPMIDNPYLKAAVAIVVSVAMGDVSGEGFSFANFTLSDPMTLISLTGAVGGAYIEQQMKDLQEEMGDFISSSTDLWEELEEKRDMLEETEFSDLMASSLLASIKTYETPTTFYTRTLIQNPGVLVYDQLENYFSSKVTLPRLNPMGST